MAFLVWLARPVWIRWLAVWILLANAADLGLTLWGLELRVIREGNPLFAAVLAWSPVLAGVLKLGAAAGGVAVLVWAYPRNPRLVLFGLTAVGVGMALVLWLHAGWIGVAMP